MLEHLLYLRACWLQSTCPHSSAHTMWGHIEAAGCVSGAHKQTESLCNQCGTEVPHWIHRGKGVTPGESRALVYSPGRDNLSEVEFWMKREGVRSPKKTSSLKFFDPCAWPRDGRSSDGQELNLGSNSGRSSLRGQGGARWAPYMPGARVRSLNFILKTLWALQGGSR